MKQLSNDNTKDTWSLLCILAETKVNRNLDWKTSVEVKMSWIHYFPSISAKYFLRCLTLTQDGGLANWHWFGFTDFSSIIINPKKSITSHHNRKCSTERLWNCISQQVWSHAQRHSACLPLKLNRLSFFGPVSSQCTWIDHLTSPWWVLSRQQSSVERAARTRQTKIEFL